MAFDAWRGGGRFGVFVGVAATSVGLIYGYDTGAIAPALLFLGEDLSLGTVGKQVVASSVAAGQIVGALAGGRVANRFGRRATLVGVVLAFALFAILSGVAPTAWFLTAARFLLGLAIGVSLVVAPLFVAESSPATIRGALLALYQVSVIAGIVIAYFVGVGLAAVQGWRWILALSALPAVVVLAVVIRLPDTPRWYLMQGRREEAYKTLKRAEPSRNTDEGLRLIEEDLRHGERGTFRELFARPFTKAGVFVVVFGFLVQITGINGIVYYSPTILQDVGFDSATEAIIGAAFVQVAGLVSVAAALFMVDRWGRRPCIISGITVMVVANAVLIASFVIGQSPALSLAGIFLFVIGFNFGFGVLVWVYSSESLPARLRGVGASALLATDLTANLIIGLVFLSMFRALGGATMFSIFLALAVFALLFVFRYAPETKGRELEEIRGYWENDAHWPRDLRP